MTGTERTARAAARASAAHAGNSPSRRTGDDAGAGPAVSTGTGPGAGTGAGAGTGLSLTERRKAATRMEIARAAARLFMTHGLRATRAEDIARAAGVAPRTFYRYFAGKEEALGPLFSAGVEKWAEAVRDAPAGLSVPDALRHAVVQTLTPGVGVRPESMEWVRSLLRLAEGSPALLRVWGEACQGAERTLEGVLAARLSRREEAADDGAPGGGKSCGGAPGGGESGGGAPGGGESGGEESCGGAPGGGESRSGESCGGAPGGGAADRGGAASGVGPGRVTASGIRLSAAVAGAAVRVAVETWAAGDDPADGPAGPVPRALSHLEALRDFPWGMA
ncbi:TetR family transcriptional regulator [Streptomyces fagopyri]|uniref:TetR family transcriptional regulator n=1 Tax=Streptomyces fagopyri TaxID=2662397 RepID=UPI0037139AE7